MRECSKDYIQRTLLTRRHSPHFLSYPHLTSFLILFYLYLYIYQPLSSSLPTTHLPLPCPLTLTPPTLSITYHLSPVLGWRGRGDGGSSLPTHSPAPHYPLFTPTLPIIYHLS